MSKKTLRATASPRPVMATVVNQAARNEAMLRHLERKQQRGEALLPTQQALLVTLQRLVRGSHGDRNL